MPENLPLVVDETTDETPETPGTEDNDTNQDDVSDLELPNEIELDGESVPVDDLADIYKTYKDDTKWQAKNTQEAQRIADERRQLETERREIEQWRREYEQKSQEPPKDNFEIPEDIEDDPYLAALYRQNADLTQKLDSLVETQERQAFEAQTKQLHADLQSQYEDYDPTKVEDAIISGRNQFEDAYLAEKWKAIQNDPGEMKTLIPDDIKNELIKQGRTELANELRKKQQMRKDAAGPTPSRTAVSKMPQGTAKNFREAREQAEKFLIDNNLSLME